MWLMSLKEEIKIHRGIYQGSVHTKERPCEDTAKRQLSASQGERPQEKPIPPISCSCISSLQNCEKISFSRLSLPSLLFCYGSSSRLVNAYLFGCGNGGRANVPMFEWMDKVSKQIKLMNGSKPLYLYFMTFLCH